MVLKVAHIGIAVNSLAEATRVFTALLGHGPEMTGTATGQDVNLALYAIGDAHIELVEPAASNSALRDYIKARGGGIHHVCLEVDDIHQELTRLKTAGMQVIDETPRPGIADTLIAFIHPKSTSGILIELLQKI